MERRVFWKHHTVAEIAETLARISLNGVTLDHRFEHLNGGVNRHAWAEEPVQSRTIVFSSDIERVLVWRTSHEPDLGKIRPRASIRASSHTQTDGVFAQSSLIQNSLKLG